MIHRSPKKTRGRTPWFLSSMGRVSVAWVKRAILVSAWRRRPKKYGELAASATCAADTACAAFQWSANWPGPTCRCSCTEVQADSGAIESAYVFSRSPVGPSMSMTTSSPRAVKIESLRAVYRLLALIHSPWKCSSRIVGRMPIGTSRAPRSAARASARLREVRRASSRSRAESPGSGRGATLSSMLNCASSVWYSGSAIASRTSSLTKAGWLPSSTRLSSISRPVSGTASSKTLSASIRSKTSRFWRTFSRYLWRSSRV